MKTDYALEKRLTIMTAYIEVLAELLVGKNVTTGDELNEKFKKKMASSKFSTHLKECEIMPEIDKIIAKGMYTQEDIDAVEKLMSEFDTPENIKKVTDKMSEYKLEENYEDNG